MKRSSATILTVLAALLLSGGWGCEAGGEIAGNDTGQDTDTSSDGDADSDVDVDADGDSDADTDTETESDTDDICFEEEAQMDVIPIRVMIAVDSSSSMLDEVAGIPKWEQARDAMIAAVEPWIDSPAIEFGIDFFPDDGSGDGCSVNAPAVFDTSEDGAGQIITYLNEVYSIGESNATPLCAGMHRFNTDADPNYAPLFTSADYDSYLILVSDGEDTCHSPTFHPPPCNKLFGWEEPVTGDIVAKGIKVYAIGFGPDGDETILNKIMQSGGTGLTEYIHASDGAALQAQLEKITQQLVSCTFDFVPDVEVDYNEINVYADGEVVPFDEECHNGAGWDWGNDEKTQILLCPEACDNLKTGAWKIISATAGCPVIIIE